RLRQPEKIPTQRSHWVVCITTYGLLGLVIGLGIWSDELILPFVVLSVVALLIARPREILGWSGAAMSLGGLIGGAPVIIANLHSRGQTPRDFALQERAPTPDLSNPPNAPLQHTKGTLTAAAPTIFGSPHVCVEPEAVYAGYASYPSAAVQQSTTTTLCAAVNSAFGLLIIGIFLFALIHLLQHLLQTPVLRRWIRRAIARLG